MWGVDPTYTLQGVPVEVTGVQNLLYNYGNAPKTAILFVSSTSTKVPSLEPVLPLWVTRFKGQRHTQCHYLFKVPGKNHQASDGGCFQHVHPFGNHPKRFFCHPKMVGYMECSKIFGIGVWQGMTKNWNYMNLIHSFILGKKNPAISRKTYQISSDTPLKIKMLNLNKIIRNLKKIIPNLHDWLWGVPIHPSIHPSMYRHWMPPCPPSALRRAAKMSRRWDREVNKSGPRYRL